VPLDERAWFEANLAHLDGDTGKLAMIVNDAVNAAKLGRGAVDALGVAPEYALPHLDRLVVSLQLAIESIAKQLAEERRRPNWGSSNQALMFAFLIGRLLTISDDASTRVIPCATALLELVPATAEHLLTIRARANPGFCQSVDDAITGLLRGAHGDRARSRRQQQYAGLRGVTRALVQRGVSLPRDWLASVAAIGHSNDPDLASYATWILSEWAIRRSVGDQEVIVESIVGPALRDAAFDARSSIRANAARGLVALTRTLAPERATTSLRIIEQLGRDRSVAVRRALMGTGSLQP
jgi:hypothetical protein